MKYSVVLLTIMVIMLLVSHTPAQCAEDSAAADESSIAGIEFNIGFQEYLGHVRQGDCRLEDGQGRMLVTAGGDYTLLGVQALVKVVGIEGALVVAECGQGGDILKAFCLGYQARATDFAADELEL